MSHNPLLTLAACLVKTHRVPAGYSFVFPWSWNITENTISFSDVGSELVSGNTRQVRETSVQVDVWGSDGRVVDATARAFLDDLCRLSHETFDNARVVSVNESQAVRTSKDSSDETVLARSTFIVEVVSSDE